MTNPNGNYDIYSWGQTLDVSSVQADIYLYGSNDTINGITEPTNFAAHGAHFFVLGMNNTLNFGAAGDAEIESNTGTTIVNIDGVRGWVVVRRNDVVLVNDHLTASYVHSEIDPSNLSDLSIQFHGAGHDFDIYNNNLNSSITWMHMGSDADFYLTDHLYITETGLAAIANDAAQLLSQAGYSAYSPHPLDVYDALNAHHPNLANQYVADVSKYLTKES